MRRPVACRECGDLIPLEQPAWWRFCSPECAAVRPRKPVVIVASVTPERRPAPKVELPSGEVRRMRACKAPGCGNWIPVKTALGRPRIYCGPKCRGRGGR